MRSTRRETSLRRYGITEERDVAIPVSAGFDIDGDIFRPAAPGRFPAILCLSPFDKRVQTRPVMPVAVCPQLVMCEGGDYNFYVRRGYAQVFANVRGTGRSGGVFGHLGDGTIQDIYDVVEWLARHNVEGTIPGYFGGCWAMHGLHLPGDVRSYETWAGPKKLTIGPPYYLDRPVYQYHYESLRWFDYWLKGIDNGIMDEPPIHLFIQNTGEWKTAYEWPLPETRWTEYYLHQGGLLSEHEFFPWETSTSFHDAPGEIYEFNIEIVPTGVLIRAGSRFGIRVKCADQDEQPRDFLDGHSLGHLWRETPARITLFHNHECPSHLLVPVTRGNRLGTFMSGGVLTPASGH